MYATGEDEPFTGVVIYRFADEKPKMARTYVDGVVHGSVTVWYPNGNKQNETTYVNGQKEGPFFSWYRSGQVEWEGAYKADRESGVWLRYDESGALLSEKDYDFQPKKTGFMLKPPRPPGG